MYETVSQNQEAERDQTPTMASSGFSNIETARRQANYKLVVIDCRYFYEYADGHIAQAINISSPLVMNYLF